jgi:hypothetical protein
MEEATVVINPRAERGSRKMLYLRDQFMLANPEEKPPIDPRRISAWAFAKGLWKPTETDPQEVLRRKISRALRHEFITDPQNRAVRASFAAVEEVMTSDGPKRMARYYPIFQAPPPIARQHFQLERRLVTESAAQLSLDLQSYNDNNDFGVRLPELDWNISREMDERSQPTAYDPYNDEEED